MLWLGGATKRPKKHENKMKYISTRGGGAAQDFASQLLSGLAADGGLYMPAYWPQVSLAQQADFREQSFAEVAAALCKLYTDASWHAALPKMTQEAFADFAAPEIAPLRALCTDSERSLWLLELFHGPTLAFKDIAMQLLARLMEHALAQRDQTATILVATSGDTGAAAVQAFAGRERLQLFVLYPHGRISDVQRRQMTTARQANVHALAVEGTFDDCQRLVKGLLQDQTARRRWRLAGVNSINWARVMAQLVYYFTALAQLPQTPAVFAVPTGNFGNIFAAYAAARMGAPIAGLLIASNSNDVLPRLVASGRYAPQKVCATTSPAMDIQWPSNLERLVFELSGRSPQTTRAAYAALAQEGAWQWPPAMHTALTLNFGAARVSDAEAAATIKRWHDKGVLLDPHSAVGLAAAERYAQDHEEARTPLVSLAAAHPAKFPDAVAEACGARPELPAALAKALDGRERLRLLPPERDALCAVLAETCG